MQIDPPVPAFTFVPTSVYEAQWIRAQGIALCRDNGLDEVEFDFATTHQFMKHFRITAEGFMESDMDLSLERETEETRRTHRGH
jgi:hypothetical protein